MTGRPAAAPFKHVSPAGVAIAGDVDPFAADLWRVGGGVAPTSLLSAYVRARDVDPKSSFGDVVVLSRPVDMESAMFLRSVICDAVIAPGYEPGVVGELVAKQPGRFLVLEADGQNVPPARERRDVQGVTIEQDRDVVDLRAVLPDAAPVEPRKLRMRPATSALPTSKLGYGSSITRGSRVTEEKGAEGAASPAASGGFDPAQPWIGGRTALPSCRPAGECRPPLRTSVMPRPVGRDSRG